MKVNVKEVVTVQKEVDVSYMKYKRGLDCIIFAIKEDSNIEEVISSLENLNCKKANTSPFAVICSALKECLGKVVRVKFDYGFRTADNSFYGSITFLDNKFDASTSTLWLSTESKATNFERNVISGFDFNPFGIRDDKETA